MKEGKLKTKLEYDAQRLKEGAMVLNALDSEKRLQILQLLHTHTKLNVTQIYMKLKWQQSMVSQQLSVLRKQNIVTTQKEGMLTYYRINYARLNEIFDYITDFLKCP